MKRTLRKQRKIAVIKAEKIKKEISVSVSSVMTNLIPDVARPQHFDRTEDFAPGFDSNISNINYHFSYMRENSSYSAQGESETVEFGTSGTLTESETTFEIAYRENEQLGMSGMESRLRFKKSTPNKINLIRKGAAPASMIFDTEVSRRPCTYSLGDEAFDFVIVTNSVSNEFSAGKGKIVLDYVIEIHGSPTEHNVYTLEYEVREQ